MSNTSNATHPFPITQQAGTQPAGRSLQARLAAIAGRGWRSLRHMVEVARTRRQLAAMDARMLADIGATPSDARIEASRWAWDTRKLPGQVGRGNARDR